ncbi:hypothetical protein [Desulfopila sp. IMCC35008]|uniref:hypothetical protein n=1 Tax=Desulfopila sp. IMCC35008 TaxID=2653858 RepID=UPI0013D02304|nr:hypothetical protein [Desulfopila sp. IMCC35008]
MNRISNKISKPENSIQESVRTRGDCNYTCNLVPIAYRSTGSIFIPVDHHLIHSAHPSAFFRNQWFSPGIYAMHQIPTDSDTLQTSQLLQKEMNRAAIGQERVVKRLMPGEDMR